MDELALILTAGRLSDASRSKIISACTFTPSLNGVGDGGFRQAVFPLGLCEGDCK